MNAVTASSRPESPVARRLYTRRALVNRLALVL